MSEVLGGPFNDSRRCLENGDVKETQAYQIDAMFHVRYLGRHD